MGNLLEIKSRYVKGYISLCYTPLCCVLEDCSICCLHRFDTAVTFKWLWLQHDTISAFVSRFELPVLTFPVVVSLWLKLAEVSLSAALSSVLTQQTKHWHAGLLWTSVDLFSDNPQTPHVCQAYSLVLVHSSEETVMFSNSIWYMRRVLFLSTSFHSLPEFKTHHWGSMNTWSWDSS